MQNVRICKTVHRYGHDDDDMPDPRGSVSPMILTGGLEGDFGGRKGSWSTERKNEHEQTPEVPFRL